MTPFLLFAEEATNDVAPSSSFSFDINMVLAIIAIVLLLPLYFSMKTFFLTARDYVMKSNTDKKIGVVILLMCLSQFAFSQTPAAASTSEMIPSVWSTIVFWQVQLIFIFLIQLLHSHFKSLSGSLKLL